MDDDFKHDTHLFALWITLIVIVVAALVALVPLWFALKALIPATSAG